MAVITLATSKGGAGKTTASIVLGTTLARSHKVIIIDADPSQRLHRWSEKADLGENLSVVISEGERTIHDEIEYATQHAEIVIIDTEGAATRTNAYAMGESDLVIIPLGNERQDADAALETIAALHVESRAMRRDIPVKLLFTRTEQAIKARLERSLNEQMRKRIGSFVIELHRRPAFSALYNEGGSLYDLDRSEFSGVERAILNAEMLASELTKSLGILTTPSNVVVLNKKAI